MWLIFLFLCSGLSQLVLKNSVKESLAIEVFDTFKGEFPCLSTNTSGKVRVLRFDIALENIGHVDFTLENKLVFYYEFIDKDNLVWLNGTVKFDCLRDKQCSESGIKHFLCNHKSLSPKCTYTRTREADCQWIDISTLPLKKYTFILSLEPVEQIIVEKQTQLVTELDLKKVEKIHRPKELIFLGCLFIFLAVDIWVIFLPCVQYEIRKTKVQSERRDI